MYLHLVESQTSQRGAAVVAATDNNFCMTAFDSLIETKSSMEPSLFTGTRIFGCGTSSRQNGKKINKKNVQQGGKGIALNETMLRVQLICGSLSRG